MMTYGIHSFSTSWFMHQIVSAIIHSAIYGFAYHLFKNLSMSGAIMACVAMLFVAWMIYKIFCTPR